MKRFLVLGLLFFYGCSSMQVTNKMPLIQKGMPKSEVLNTLGSPARYGNMSTDEKGKQLEVWIYEEKNKQGIGKGFAKFIYYIITFGGYYFVDSLYGRKDFNVYEFTFVDSILDSIRSQKGEQSPAMTFGFNINQTQVNPIQ